ncbi:MAG TPA: hypothetical protein VFE53_25330 [Mucilaginibacter sp.]|jgi:hypothetical protein|nr:hypothetical protein [Mucilaginibacter sp.]
MNLKQLITLFTLAILLASCSKVYTPALYHQDIAYQPKPASFDSIKSVTYASAGINTYLNDNFSDLLVSGQANLSRGHVFNNFNLAYGAFGVFGDYENGMIQKGQPNYFTDKFFGAVGGRGSANFFVNSGRTDFRFIGVEMAYSHEFGDFASFRQMVQSQSGYFVDPRTDLFSIGLTSEVLFHNVNDASFQHGIRVYLGTTFGTSPLEGTYYTDQTGEGRFFRSIYPKASYFITFKKFFGTIEAGENIFVRFGVKF